MKLTYNVRRDNSQEVVARAVRVNDSISWEFGSDLISQVAHLAIAEHQPAQARTSAETIASEMITLPPGSGFQIEVIPS